MTTLHIVTQIILNVVRQDATKQKLSMFTENDTMQIKTYQTPKKSLFFIDTLAPK